MAAGYTQTCPYHDPNAMTNTACDHDVTTIVAAECASQSTPSSCDLTPTNGLFTDPCQGTYKYSEGGIHLSTRCVKDLH